MSDPLCTSVKKITVSGWGAGTTLVAAEYIPRPELWLWKNPSALASVRRGLRQMAEGKVVSLGSFAEFADLPVED